MKVHAGVVYEVHVFESVRDAEDKRDELVKSKDYDEGEDCVDLTHDVEVIGDISCGNCGEPMYSHEAYCPKCSYPVDAEEQKNWQKPDRY